MTTIPNLNIVIQQGDSVRESHNVRNHVLDAAQQTVFQRTEEDDKKRTVVSQTEEAEKLLMNKEKSPEGKHKREKVTVLKKKDEAGESEKDDAFDPDEPGHLLNTIV